MPTKIDGTNGVLQSYDYQVLTTGFTYTFASGTTTLIANPAGTLATGTITMPAAPADGMVITVTSTQPITALTVNANTGQTINNGGALGLQAGGVLSYMYNLANTKWQPFNAGLPLGAGQTWQSVTRTSGTTYTNTTGRPILVSFYTGTATPGNAFVNGAGITTSASASNFTFVVPAGATYSCFSISAASELR